MENITIYYTTYINETYKYIELDNSFSVYILEKYKKKKFDHEKLMSFLSSVQMREL